LKSWRYESISCGSTIIKESNLFVASLAFLFQGSSTTHEAKRNAL